MSIARLTGIIRTVLIRISIISSSLRQVPVAGISAADGYLLDALSWRLAKMAGSASGDIPDLFLKLDDVEVGSLWG